MYSNGLMLLVAVPDLQ